jgi:hypothetical protein
MRASILFLFLVVVLVSCQRNDGSGEMAQVDSAVVSQHLSARPSKGPEPGRLHEPVKRKARDLLRDSLQGRWRMLGDPTWMMVVDGDSLTYLSHGKSVGSFLFQVLDSVIAFSDTVKADSGSYMLEIVSDTSVAYVYYLDVCRDSMYLMNYPSAKTQIFSRVRAGVH